MARYLKNMSTGVVYPYADKLAERIGIAFVEVDSEGNVVDTGPKKVTRDIFEQLDKLKMENKKLVEGLEIAHRRIAELENVKKNDTVTVVEVPTIEDVMKAAEISVAPVTPAMSLTKEQTQEIADKGRWSVLSKPDLISFAKHQCGIDFTMTDNAVTMKRTIKKALDKLKKV
jgi:hypothetical protein